LVVTSFIYSLFVFDPPKLNVLLFMPNKSVVLDFEISSSKVKESKSKLSIFFAANPFFYEANPGLFEENSTLNPLAFTWVGFIIGVFESGSEFAFSKEI